MTAYAAARQTDIGTQTLVNRWHAETLLVVEGQPANVRAVMFHRMAVLFEVMVDRRSWPAEVRGLRERAHPRLRAGRHASLGRRRMNSAR